MGKERERERNKFLGKNDEAGIVNCKNIPKDIGKHNYVALVNDYRFIRSHCCHFFHIVPISVTFQGCKNKRRKSCATSCFTLFS